MPREKGQIQIVFIVLIVIGIVLFTLFPQLFKGFSEQAPVSKPASSPVLSPVPAPASEPESKPAPDITPPNRFNPQPSGELPAQTRQVTLSLQTNEKAVCRYSDVSGVYYEYMQASFSETGGKVHSTLITGLSEGENYLYFIRCIDEEANKNMTDFGIAFRVKAGEDIIPPERFYLLPTGNLPAGTSAVQLSVSTNEPASCRYAITGGADYNSMTGRLSPDATMRQHVVAVGGLQNGRAYEYFVRCKDLAGNKNTGDVMIRFEIGL